MGQTFNASRNTSVHGVAEATISAPLQRAWGVMADFYGLKKWVPTVEECYEIEAGVRFVKSFPTGNGPAKQVKEKLISLQPDTHSLSYQMIEGNMGLLDYVATVKLDAVDEATTRVNWSFVMSPKSSTSVEQQQAFLTWGIQRLQEASGAES